MENLQLFRAQDDSVWVVTFILSAFMLFIFKLAGFGFRSTAPATRIPITLMDSANPVSRRGRPSQIMVSMLSSSLLGFAGVALVVVLAPGPDTFLALRYALNRPRNGIAAALGMMTSIMGWAALAGLGVAALLQTYPAIHQRIALVGGAYLLYLGIGSLIKAQFLARAAAATARTTTRSATASATEYTFFQSVRAGMISAALNPKLGLLFLALMPQFIPVGSNMLGSAMLLGGIFALMGFAYLSLLTAIAARAMAWFKSPTVGIWLEGVSSAALAIMGAVVFIGAFR